ncbi:MAG: hypothetical protein JO209_11480 [Acidisphaera sp.]|nr:hypothetical protein [Acidisphaera sp.]
MPASSRAGLIRNAARRVTCRAGPAAVPLAALLAFALAAGLYRYAPGAYSALLRLFGVPEQPFGYPFLDTQFVLAQIDCWRRGIDVYVVNPCDALGRLHDYSPLWLRLPLPTGLGWSDRFGLLVDLGFLLSLFFLPRPATRLDGALLLAATLSQVTAFGLERGNTDLLIFALAVAAGRLWLRAPALRAAGYAVVFGAGLLKFFPLVLFVVALRERLRDMLAIALAGCAGLVGFVLAYHAELRKLAPNIAGPNYFGDMFGATILPHGAAIAASVLLGWAPAWLPGALLALLCAASLGGAARLAGDAGFAGADARLLPRTRLFLVMGALLVCGCFFAHASIRYRAVFLLFALPGLLALGRGMPAGPARCAVLGAAAAALFLMWSMRFGLAGWLPQQVAWWWAVSVLAGVLLRFAARAAAMRELTAWRRLQLNARDRTASRGGAN